MSYADINGVSLYHEPHGAGDPLLLLHGGFGSVEMFAPLLPALAGGRQVIGVDLQGHGRTADIDRPLRYESMADDIAGLVARLGYERADVLGYSLGGGVALRTAIQYPAVVRRLVLVSTPYQRAGWYPEVLAGMAAIGPDSAEAMKHSPLYEVYAKIAPRVEDWPVLATKVGELLRREYDWSAEVPGIQARTLLVYGDADSVPVTHMADFFGLLGGGKQDAGWDGAGRPDARLAVLPGRTHYDICTAPELAQIAVAFFDEP